MNSFKKDEKAHSNHSSNPKMNDEKEDKNGLKKDSHAESAHKPHDNSADMIKHDHKADAAKSGSDVHAHAQNAGGTHKKDSAINVSSHAEQSEKK